MSVPTLTLADFFKIGPGPSSSHTLAPMRAGRDFIESVRELPSHKLAKGTRIEVRLFGSLSATGSAHNTEKAVLAGLLEHAPESVDPALLQGLLQTRDEEHVLDLGPIQVPISGDDIISDALKHRYPFKNTLVITLWGKENRKLFERHYYSVGAGMLQWKGNKAPAQETPPHAFENCAQLRECLASSGLNIPELMLANEQALTGQTTEQITLFLDSIIDTMQDSVRRGLKAQSPLPGLQNLQRRACALLARVQEIPPGEGQLFLRLSACAVAAAEENASGGRGVTAPGFGAGGILPAVLYLLQEDFQRERAILREGLLVAAAIGFAVNNNPAIAGADVGCQGEIGLASAMAAALLAHTWGYGFEGIEHAAATALRHHLGLTCDPAGGAVLVPCVERNAMGAIKAYNAALMSGVVDDPDSRANLDKVVDAMALHGRDISDKFKEIAKSGLTQALPLC